MTNEIVKISKALADETRFEILKTIHEKGEINCGQITEFFTISQPAVSHHLKILIDAGLVNARREGQHTYYSVNQATFKAYLSQIESSFL